MGLGLSVYSTVFVGLMGATNALNPIVAQHFGGGRLAAIGATYVQGLWMALFLSALGVFPLLFGSLWLPVALRSIRGRGERRALSPRPRPGLAWSAHVPRDLLGQHRGVAPTRRDGPAARGSRAQGVPQLPSHPRRPRAAPNGRGGRCGGFDRGLLGPLPDGIRLHAAQLVLSPLRHPLGVAAVAGSSRDPPPRHSHEPVLHARGDVVHRHHAARRTPGHDGDGRPSGGRQPGRPLLHASALPLGGHRHAHRPGDRRG